MASLPSPWARRVQQLVDFTIAWKYYPPNVPMVRVDSSLHDFAMCTAKHLQLMEKETPKENPWIASLRLYVCLGDTPHDTAYGETTEFEAGVCIGQALRAGWSIADMLQAIEWTKGAMGYYPTIEQWANIFEVTPEAIVEAQQGLVPRLVDALGASEKTAWDVACSLDAPFHYWTTQLTTTHNTASIALPELGLDA